LLCWCITIPDLVDSAKLLSAVGLGAMQTTITQINKILKLIDAGVRISMCQIFFANMLFYKISLQ